MKTLRIGNKDYKIEYSIDASLCEDCVEKVTNFMLSTANVQGEDAIKYVIGTMSNLPNTALSMFYGGLIAHHGEEGDKTVNSKSDVKELLKQYILEHKEDGVGNYYDIIGMFIEQMGEEGFFDLIGLTKLVQMTVSKPKKSPQDHKTKQKTTKTIES